MASTEDDVVVRLRLKDVAKFIADVKSGRLAIDDLEKKISKAGRTAARESESSGGGFGKLGRVLGGLKWYALGAVGSLAAAAGSVGGFAVKSASDLQQVTISYQTLMGSASAAHATLASLRKFAIDTPFQLPTLEEAGKLLLAYKFSAQSLIPTLTAVGDAASALSLGDEGVTGIVNVLGQIKGASVLHGQDLLQLTSRGIMAKDWLEQAFHLTPQQLDKAISKSKISAAAAIPVILAGMEKQFKGQMATQSKTFGGVASNVVDAVRDALTNVANPYLPAMTAWLQRVIDLVGSPNFQKALSETINRVIAGAKVAFDIGKQVFAWGEDAASQAADWVKGLIALIQAAVASGDWSPVGASLGTSLRGLLLKGVNLGDAVGGAAQGIDWFDVGKKFAGGAIGFVLGFAIALFDPGTWWPVIQKHWLAILIGILTMLPVGKVLGVFGKVLAKLPLLGKLGEWLVGLGGGLMKAGGPVWKFINHVASGIGNAFVKVWPELGTHLWYWGSRIGEFFSKDIPGLGRRLKDWIFNGAKRLPEWLATKFFQAIDWLITRMGKVAGRIWAPIMAAFGQVVSWLTDKWEAFLSFIGLGGDPGAGQYKPPPGSANGGSATQPGPIIMPGMAATGGTVQRPGMTWVGERGPELLNLPTGSKVIPLPRTPEAVGRGPVHVHVMLNQREIAQAVYDDMGDRVARR